MNHTQEGIEIRDGFIYKIISYNTAINIYNELSLFALHEGGSESLIVFEDDIKTYERNHIQIGIPVGTLDESYLIRQLEKDHAFILWSKKDVIDRAEQDGIELTEDQISDCIDYLHNKADCDYGITWDSIDNVIEKFKND